MMMYPGGVIKARVATVLKKSELKGGALPADQKLEVKEGDACTLQEGDGKVRTNNDGFHTGTNSDRFHTENNGFHTKHD